MDDDPRSTTARDGRTSRRRVLTMLGAGGVVAATALPRREAAAADGDPLLAGGFNQASSRTMLEGSVDGNCLLWLQNWSQAPASDGLVVVNWGGGFAVQGSAAGGGVGVWGRSVSADGVQGWSESGNGVNGSSGTGVGGNFSTRDGRALQVDGEAFFARNADNFAVGIDNGVQGDRASALYATSRGSRATIEGENGGAGPGVRGIGTAGHGGEFRSGSGSAVVAHGNAFVDQPDDRNALDVLNRSTGPRAGGVMARVYGGLPAVQGNQVGDTGPVNVAILGSSDASDDPSGWGRGSGVGVAGSSGSGAGVTGHSESGAGGRFSTTSGVALQVVGPAEFSGAGSATVPQGASSVFVTDSRVTADSHVSVTLVGDPGRRSVTWVERTAGAGFRVHVTPVPLSQRTALPFTYLVVEPSSG